MVDFYDTLARVQELLQREGRLSYRGLRRQFGIDDAFIDDLKAELIDVKRLARDEGGTILVWTGEKPAAQPPAPVPAASPLAYTPTHLSEQILASRGAIEGERKLVTVCFADIKGSTELIEDLDPEDAQRVLDPTVRMMMEAVHRFEGTVTQVAGDGIVALFGAPLAHEDHALRACYAALAMQAAMRRFAEEILRARGLMLRIRVGLNSGEVVVRAIRTDLHMDYSAVGTTVHLAARMEQIASPGSILITVDTLKLVDGLVQVTALGPTPVKGIAEPLEVFELTGASSVRRRLQAASARGFTRFVGRDAEIGLLGHALEMAARGQGQVVAVQGEAGVGKSRLVHEFARSHRTNGWLVIDSGAQSFGTATAYLPVIDLLRRYTDVDDHDDERSARAKITGRVITLDATLQDALPPLLGLFDLLPAGDPFRALDPARRRRLTQEALTRLFLREAQVQPLLLIVEDLHWSDSESGAWLDRLVESLPGSRVLLVVNYRPEHRHDWGSKSFYTQLRLDPLSPADAATSLSAMIGDDPTLSALKRQLIERTQGNPFFLEESVHTLVETRAVTGEPGRYRLAAAAAIQMPATVQAMIAARMDRLSPEDKGLLQTASVIGTDFTLPLLQAVADRPEEALLAGLRRLLASEFVYETRLFPTREFVFRHALTHEVAYSSLLQDRRRLLHARILEALERLDPDQVERLAHHAVRGESWESAARHCRMAAMRALDKSMYQESIVQLESALAALKRLPESRETTERIIDLHLDFSAPLQMLRDFERLGVLLGESSELAEKIQDRRRLGYASVGLARSLWANVSHERGIEIGRRAVSIGRELGDVGLEAVANYAVAFAHHDLSQYEAAAEHLSRNVAILGGENLHRRLGMANPPSILSRGLLGWCHGWRGDFPAGQAIVDEAMAIAEDMRSQEAVRSVLGFRGLLQLMRGDLPGSITSLEREIGMVRETQATPAPAIMSFLAHAYALSGRLEEALALFDESLREAAAKKFLPCNSLWIGWWGEAALEAGRVDEAQGHADRALSISHRQKERGYEAFALRLQGNIMCRRKPADLATAEASYRAALDRAVALGMRPLEAHCRHDLGQLLARAGRGAEARSELAQATKLYSAMAMALWLPEEERALARIG